MPDYERVAGLLPDPDARWIVFRDAEWPISVTSAGGKVYGHRGEVGPWAYGVTVAPAHCRVRRSEGFGFDRWVLVSPGPLVLKVADLTGRCAVTIWRPNGRQESGFYQVLDGRSMAHRH